jgi:hypothetical protein
MWAHGQPRCMPSPARSEEGVRGCSLTPLCPGLPLRGLQMSRHLAGLHHGGHWVSSWGQEERVLGKGSLRASTERRSGPEA